MDLVVRLLADGALIVLLAVCVVVLMWSMRHRIWSTVPVMVMAGLTSLLVGKLMSLLYQPAIARPFIELGVSPGAAYIDNPGFPSDHALLATVAVVAVYAVTRRKWLVVALALVLVLMSVARVVALVHTPLDIIGGIAAGLAGVVWYRKLTIR